MFVVSILYYNYSPGEPVDVVPTLLIAKYETGKVAHALEGTGLSQIV
jgi:hypothetical protein